MTDICQLCGHLAPKKDKMTPLFHEDGSSSKYTMKIELFLHVKIIYNVSQSLSIPVMCPTCERKIKNWEKYAKHVKNTQEFLKDMVQMKASANLSNGELSESSVSIKVKADEPLVSGNSQRSQSETVKVCTIPKHVIEGKKREFDDSGCTDDVVDRDSDSQIHDESSKLSQRSSDDESIQTFINRQKKKSVTPKRTKTKTNISWECSVCLHVLKSWNELVQHYIEHHEGVDAHVLCGCGKTLYCRTSVIKHHHKHNSAEPKYKCDKCEKSYIWKRLLDDHVLSHLPKEEQPFLCCKCSRRFYSESLLKKHEKQHLPADQKPLFPCKICDKTLSTKAALQSHVRSIHLNHRSFVCDQCGLSFNFKGILQEHLLVHTNVYNFHCKECGKSFKTKYRLKNHIDTHLNTSYECPECGLSLNTRRTLRMHLLVHKDNRPHVCSICGKQFKRSKDLKNHALLHTGQRPYICTFCPRTFANGSNCRAHKRRMHPDLLRQYEDDQEIALSSSQEQKIYDEVDDVVPRVKVERVNTTYNTALDLVSSRVDPLFSQHSIFTS